MWWEEKNKWAELNGTPPPACSYFSPWLGPSVLWLLFVFWLKNPNVSQAALVISADDCETDHIKRYINITCPPSAEWNLHLVQAWLPTLSCKNSQTAAEQNGGRFSCDSPFPIDITPYVYMHTIIPPAFWRGLYLWLNTGRVNSVFRLDFLN